jgi:hypothetical protein
MIGYEIYDRFYNEAFYIASKNNIDDQNLLLATVPIRERNFWISVEGTFESWLIQL